MRMMRITVILTFLRVSPPSYRIIVGFGQELEQISVTFLRNNGEKRPILRLLLSISPKEWLFPGFNTDEQELTVLRGIFPFRRQNGLFRRGIFLPKRHFSVKTDGNVRNIQPRP